jgi:predicted AAA+ superfamily ATPase
VEYQPRLADGLLGELLAELPAIAVEGAKGVGKTATAERFAAEVFSLDKDATLASVAADPEIIAAGGGTTFVDEWQLVPPVWNVVKRAVDRGAAPGRFLLAGSAAPKADSRIHSGAGRIVSLVMRPLSLPERQVETPSVSLAALMSGERPEIRGATSIGTADYVEEILSSGFPGIRRASPRGRGLLLDGYLTRIVERDIPQAEGSVRRPALLREWLTAYAAATATTASYNSLAAAAHAGEEDVPAKSTTAAYRDLLKRIFVLDPVPAWVPSFSRLKRIAQAPKHHLVDPALAARLVGADAAGLVRGEGTGGQHPDGTFLGALFESLATQTVRALAELAEASVFHLRDQNAEREIDLRVQRPDHRLLAIEVKLATAIRPKDVRNLNWLEEQLGDRVLDKVVVNTGDRAFRRPDGVAVIPLALLGP